MPEGAPRPAASAPSSPRAPARRPAEGSGVARAMPAAPAFARMSDCGLAGRRVLIRADLNVPLAGGKVANAARIRASVPTFEQALAAGAAVTVASHLGRPAAGRFDPALSMAPVAARLAEALGRKVPVVAGWPDAGAGPAPGALALAENVRFLAGETANDEGLARRMAATCDVFVMDAFGTAHRAHASTAGVVRHAPAACAGPLLAAELDALGQALVQPARPVVAVVGGAKVAGKIELLENLAGKVDRLIVGGGIANTFLAAAGLPVGASLVDGERVPFTERLLARAAAEGVEIVLPSDVVVARELSADTAGVVKPVREVGPADRILDIGPESAGHLARIAGEAGTIIWNGPVGAFECPPFAAGTARLAEAIAASPAFSIAGGGDTLAAIEAFGVSAGLSRISTGGGAFLEFLEGRKLPAVAALEAARKRARAVRPPGGHD